MKKEAKVALYARVSTPEQTNENQLIELRRFCQSNNYEIAGEYQDTISGSKATRPGLDMLLKDMRQNKFKAVVVYKYDRLGRSTLHCLQTLEELKNKGVRFIATSQSIDTGTPMGKWFVINLLGLAEMERELIRERIKLGLERAKKAGKIKARGKDKKRRRKSGYLLRWNNYQQVAG